jgi:general secretion pathway protein G
MSRKFFGKIEKGFTLIELMTVISVIAILAVIAIPHYLAYKDKAKVAAATADLKAIQLAIEVLATDTNRWPGPNDVGVTADQEVWDLNAGIAGLVSTNGAFPNWDGPYLESVPTDPWGNNYFFDPDYRIDGEDFVVVGSFGPNGVGPNTYDADDVRLLIPSR